MRKLTFMLLILLAAIGCSKKEEDTPKPDPVVLPKYMEYTGVIEADQSVVVLKFDGYFKNADNTPDYDTPIYVSADKIYSFIVNNGSKGFLFGDGVLNLNNGWEEKVQENGNTYYIFRFDIQNSGSITLMPTKYYKPMTPEDIEKNKRRTTRPFVLWYSNHMAGLTSEENSNGYTFAAEYGLTTGRDTCSIIIAAGIDCELSFRFDESIDTKSLHEGDTLKVTDKYVFTYLETKDDLLRFKLEMPYFGYYKSDFSDVIELFLVCKHFDIVKKAYIHSECTFTIYQSYKYDCYPDVQWCDFWFPEDQLLQKAWHKRNNIIDLTDGSAILTCNVVVGGLDRFNFNDLVAVENNQSWCIVSFEPVWGEYSVFFTGNYLCYNNVYRFKIHIQDNNTSPDQKSALLKLKIRNPAGKYLFAQGFVNIRVAR